MSIEPPSEPSRATVSRGGWRGLFDGRQSLALAFWLLGVAAGIILMVSGRLLTELTAPTNAKAALLTSLLLIAGWRVCAWYSILKCRHNTSSEAFRALALITVVLDLVYCVYRVPATLLTLMLT